MIIAYILADQLNASWSYCLGLMTIGSIFIPCLSISNTGSRTYNSRKGSALLWKVNTFLSPLCMTAFFMLLLSLWCPHSSSIMLTQSMRSSLGAFGVGGSQTNLVIQRTKRQARVNTREPMTMRSEAIAKGLLTWFDRPSNRLVLQQSIAVVMIKRIGTIVSSISFTQQIVKVCWAMLFLRKLEITETYETSKRMTLLYLLPILGYASKRKRETSDSTHRGTSCCHTKPTLNELIVKRKAMCWQGSSQSICCWLRILTSSSADSIYHFLLISFFEFGSQAI